MGKLVVRSVLKCTYQKREGSKMNIKNMKLIKTEDIGNVTLSILKNIDNNYIILKKHNNNYSASAEYAELDNAVHLYQEVKKSI